MNNTISNVKFVHHYFDCHPFKQKDAQYLLKLIATTRLNDDMRFNGFGNISFGEGDEERKEHPVITFANEDGTLMEWGRKNSNCMCFNLLKTDKNQGYYDKLYLYHTNSHANAGLWYGWIAYNSKTKEYTHKFFIDHDPMDLMLSLNRWLYHLNIKARNKKILNESRTNMHKF